MHARTYTCGCFTHLWCVFMHVRVQADHVGLAAQIDGLTMFAEAHYGPNTRSALKLG